MDYCQNEGIHHDTKELCNPERTKPMLDIAIFNITTETNRNKLIFKILWGLLCPLPPICAVRALFGCVKGDRSFPALEWRISQLFAISIDF